MASILKQMNYFRGTSFNARVNQDTALSNTSIQAAPGTGLCNYITDIHIRQGGTSRVVQLLDGSGGTVIWEAEVAANGTYDKTFCTPLACTAATALVGTMADGSTGFFLAVNGFIAYA